MGELTCILPNRYRIFAELLELAHQAGNLVIPPVGSFQPPPAVSSHHSLSSVLNPATVLQHPGFYYYEAARCTLRRRECFQKALDEEKDALEVCLVCVFCLFKKKGTLTNSCVLITVQSESGAASGFVSTSPGFANEKKTDHSALIVEVRFRAIASKAPSLI